jgi:hypothetical protein
MRNRLASWNRALAAAAVLLLGLPLSASDRAKDQAKVYESELAPMMGLPYYKVAEKLEGWKFEALEIWQLQDPTAKEVGKHNRSKVKFSKKEIEQVFGPPGYYKVVVYNKLLSTDTTTIGEVNEMGMGVLKDTKITLAEYAVVRAVFRDDKMIVFKVWPKLDQSNFSSGTTYRRGR